MPLAEWKGAADHGVGGNWVNNQNVAVSATDPSCTGLAAAGNVSCNRFRGPFQQKWDMSFIKISKSHEQTSLEFRAEMFGDLNHAILVRGFSQTARFDSVSVGRGNQRASKAYRLFRGPYPQPKQITAEARRTQRILDADERMRPSKVV